MAAGAASPTCDLSVVVPVYREESNIGPFLSRTEAVLDGLGVTYEIIFCLDPSPDGTEEAILGEINRNPRIRLVVFSRRFGQPSATIAGLMLCGGRACVVIDADLQDPPELIPEMLSRLKEGYEVVSARRRSRKGETPAKRIVAKVGYWVIGRLSEVEIPRDTGDFRVVSRRVVEELRNLNESHGFLRGLVAYVGFRQTAVDYERDERARGRGKYNPFVGSLRIGLNGVIGFSSRPLQLLALTGLLLVLLSLAAGGWLVFRAVAGTPPGPPVPATILVVTFFAGVQLLGLGLMGEYVGRIYDEVKRRPPYIVDRQINFPTPG